MQMHANLMLVLLHPEVKKLTVVYGEEYRETVIRGSGKHLHDLKLRREQLHEAVTKVVAATFNLPDPFEDAQASGIIEAAMCLLEVGRPEWA